MNNECIQIGSARFASRKCNRMIYTNRRTSLNTHIYYNVLVHL